MNIKFVCFRTERLFMRTYRLFRFIYIRKSMKKGICINSKNHVPSPLENVTKRHATTNIFSVFIAFNRLKTDQKKKQDKKQQTKKNERSDYITK